jgi:transposase
MPPQPPDPKTKRQTLRRHGTLNPHPEAVAYPLFHSSDFFDPADLVQVKYEMLRQVHVDKHSVSESADTCGLSRPSFYQAQAALQKDGLFGLIPHKRGPQGGHKLTTEVMEFVAEQRTADPSRTAQQLAESVRKRFQVQVHARSIQRQLLRQKKRS